MDSAWRQASAAAIWDELLIEGQTQCRCNAEHLKKETAPVVETLCVERINPLKAELNPICHLLALLGGATIVVVSRLRVKALYIVRKNGCF